MTQAPAQWLSEDPRNSKVVEYDAATTAILEQAFQAGKAEVPVVLGGMTFRVKLREMRQYNTSGGSRRVIRIGDEAPMPQIPPLGTDVIAAALSAVAAVDTAVADIEKNEAVRRYPVPQRLCGSTAPILAVFDHILHEFANPKYKTKYGDDGSNMQLLRHSVGESVPAYYANVSDGQTIYYRKLLSILGLRNLVDAGPAIFAEMREKHFSGDINAYKQRTGPHKMKYLTGNVVDLDTTVLRCHERPTVDAVNAAAKKAGTRTFRNGKELAASPEGQRIAMQQAKVLIDGFVDQLKLSAAEVTARHLDLQIPDSDDAIDIHVSTGNSDRGTYPIWKYSNVGVLTFHANVPSLPDVYGALLRAPYHMAKAFALVKAGGDGVPSLDDFFEDCVADSCFNAKWKAIEAFCSVFATRGGVDDVLDKLQQANQAYFMRVMASDDDDGTAELAAMQKLVADQRLTARDATGATRAITPADVGAWHKKRLNA